MKSQKLGGYAALGIALTGILMLFTVLVGLGAEAAANPALIATLVTTKTTPLAFIEVLKIIQGIATITVVRIVAQQWAAGVPPMLRVATGFGILAGVFLLLAGVIGLGALALALQATALPSTLDYVSLNMVVNGFGRVSQFANGFWFLLIGWMALQQHIFAKRWAYLAIVVGILHLIASLFPPIGLLLLLLVTVWWVWFGSKFLQQSFPILQSR